MSDDQPTIDVPDSGPFLVKGLKKLTDAQDQPIDMEKDVIALCRCGASTNEAICARPSPASTPCNVRTIQPTLSL